MAEKRSFFGKIKDFFGNLFKPEDDPIARGPINPPISKEEREQAFESLRNGTPYSSLTELQRSDPRVAQKAVELDGKVLNEMSDINRNNKNIVMAAVKENPSAIQYAYPTMQKDPDVFRAAFGFDGGPKPLENPSALLMATQKNAVAMKIAPEEYKRSKPFAMKAAELNGMALKDLGSFKADRDVVAKAIQQNPRAIEFANTKNKDVALEVLKVDGNQLRNMPELQNDFDAVMKATSQNGMALQFASNEMRDKQEIVKNAVQENGMALQFSGDIKDEKEVALIAAEKDSHSMKFMSQELRQDPNVFEKAFGVSVGKNGIDKDTMLKAIKKDDFAMEMAPASLKDNREFIKEAVKTNGEALRWLPKFQEDKEILDIANGRDKPKTMDEVFAKYLPKDFNEKTQNDLEKNIERDDAAQKGRE